MKNKTPQNGFLLRGGKTHVFFLILCFLSIKTVVFSQKTKKKEKDNAASNTAQTAQIAAQNTELPTDDLRERHLSFGIGMNWETRRDDLFSPLRYSGIGANLQNSLEWLTEKHVRQVMAYGSANMIQSRVSKGYNYEGYSFRYGVSFNYMRRLLRGDNRFRWYAGGGFASLGSWSILPANVNNYVSFNVPTGFFASTYVRKDLRLFRRNWILGAQLTLPVLSYNARPEFIGVWDEKAFLNDYRIVTLNRLFQMDWRWTFDIPLANDNRWRFTYRWDYLSDKTKGKGSLQIGSQIGTVEFLANLAYKKNKKS